MISRRRLTLQLTPLLDLLLIVVFIQFFQLRDREQTVVGEQQALAQERQTLVSEKDAARVELAELMRRLDFVRERLEISELMTREAKTSADQDRQALSQSQTDLQRILAQQQMLGQLMHDLFQVPPDEVSRMLKESRSPGSPQTSAEQARLEQRFRQLANATPGKMLEHLLSYEEIRKRCDVWSMHVDAKGIVVLNDGVRSTRIRIPTGEDDEILTEQFVNDLFTWYRSLPQPKSLVVILLTYDRDVRIYTTESVRRILPLWVERMQTDSAGRSRFEYADLGFRIE